MTIRGKTVQGGHVLEVDLAKSRIGRNQRGDVSEGQPRNRSSEGGDRFGGPTPDLTAGVGLE
jgi:hypothetical protein